MTSIESVINQARPRNGAVPSTAAAPVSVAGNSVCVREIWSKIRDEALIGVRDEQDLALYLNESILRPNSLLEALASILASKLASLTVLENQVYQSILRAFQESPSIVNSVCHDLQAVVERDPVAGGYLTPFLFFTGWQTDGCLPNFCKAAHRKFLESTSILPHESARESCWIMRLESLSARRQ